jgi:hypothetical protein
MTGESLTKVEVEQHFERSVLPLLQHLAAVLDGLGSVPMDPTIGRAVEHVRRLVAEASAISLAISTGSISGRAESARPVRPRRPEQEENPCRSLRDGLLFLSSLSGRLATTPGLGGVRREAFIDLAERTAAMARMVPEHVRLRR